MTHPKHTFYFLGISNDNKAGDPDCQVVGNDSNSMRSGRKESKQLSLI
jgi:hypothetical protein